MWLFHFLSSHRVGLTSIPPSLTPLFFQSAFVGTPSLSSSSLTQDNLTEEAALRDQALAAALSSTPSSSSSSSSADSKKRKESISSSSSSSSSSAVEEGMGVPPRYIHTFLLASLPTHLSFTPSSSPSSLPPSSSKHQGWVWLGREHDTLSRARTQHGLLAGFEEMPLAFPPSFPYPADADGTYMCAPPSLPPSLLAFPFFLAGFEEMPLAFPPYLHLFLDYSPFLPSLPPSLPPLPRRSRHARSPLQLAAPPPLPQAAATATAAPTAAAAPPS